MKIQSGLTNGQVLQRLGAGGATAILQGESSAAGPILATLSKAGATLRGWKQKAVGKTAGGQFKVKLADIPAGGPYRLRLEAGAARVEIPTFFVGDVWILAGQSNMEGVGLMAGKAQPRALVRAFSMRREWRLAEDPLHILAESPDASHAAEQCTPEKGEEMRRDATRGVGPGLFFARDMLERTGVPQGLICTAHGGTSMTQWNPAQKHLGGQSLYGSMLASVQATGQPVAGLLWYQGESDANPADAAVYSDRMKELVAATRRDLGQPRLPWVVVQIARVFSPWSSPLAWNWIQEEQRLLPEKIKFLETVPAIDLSLDDGIHISSAGYPRLAARLASAADRLTHGNTHEAPMPRLRSVRLSEKPSFTIDVAFDHVRGGLRSEGEPTGFKFVSAAAVPLDLIYKTELLDDTARLYFDGKPAPGTVLFYGHGVSPTCNITDGRGFALPVMGPIALGREEPIAFLPFVTQWEVTDIIPSQKKLDQMPLARIKTLARAVRNYPADGFVNEHAAWEGKSGQAFFQSRLHLPEAMTVDFLIGYDGPFRLWLDDKPFFTDMKGANPCLPDAVKKATKLNAGTHALQVGMDLDGGRAWGFYLRLARTDVGAEKLWLGEFAKPIYSV